MTKTVIQERIKIELEEIGYNSEDFVTNASLALDLGLDSIDIVELVRNMELIFNLQDYIDIENINTIDDLIHAIQVNLKRTT